MYPPISVGGRATATPIFLVYGNRNYTKVSALEEAAASGIGELAAKEKGVVLFINPAGDAWSIADKESLSAAVDLYSDKTLHPYPGGKSQEGKYPGSRVRVYVFAEGRGADFVASQLVAGVSKKAQYTSDIESFKPTAVLLDNVSANIVAANDGVEVPCFMINGNDKIFDACAKLNTAHNKVGRRTSRIKYGFDGKALRAGYEKVISTAIRRNQTICDVPRYDKLGIIFKQEFIRHFADNIEYFTYVPEDIKNSPKGTVPLVIIFHGMANHAETQAWWSGWPIIGKENKFMVVSVNRHDETAPASVAIELVDYLVKEYPMIDRMRIYAGGFSMGAVKSWSLGNLYPEIFAGIIPTNGAFSPPEAGADTKHVMPVFYAAGEMSPFPELPHQKQVFIYGKSGEPNGVDTMLAYFLKRNGVTDNYLYDKEVNELWGIKPDKTYTVQSKQFGDVKVTVNEFKSRDGNAYTVLASNSNSGHEPLEVTCRAAWNFIRQFSRNADGTIKISSDSSTCGNSVCKSERYIDDGGFDIAVKP